MVLGSGPAPTFTKALVREYRGIAACLRVSAATFNLRLAPPWGLAREMADSVLLDPSVAAAIRILYEKFIWRLVVRYARESELGEFAPHHLRWVCAKPGRRAGGDLEQIQRLRGHASVQTTERHLGTEQNLALAVNDGFGLEPGGDGLLDEGNTFDHAVDRRDGR